MAPKGRHTPDWPPNFYISLYNRDDDGDYLCAE